MSSKWIFWHMICCSNIFRSNFMDAVNVVLFFSLSSLKKFPLKYDSKCGKRKIELIKSKIEAMSKSEVCWCRQFDEASRWDFRHSNLYVVNSKRHLNEIPRKRHFAQWWNAIDVNANAKTREQPGDMRIYIYSCIEWNTGNDANCQTNAIQLKIALAVLWNQNEKGWQTFAWSTNISTSKHWLNVGNSMPDRPLRWWGFTANKCKIVGRDLINT